MAESSDSALCPDWAFLNNANVHIAKNRGWFKTYTPFPSTLNNSPFATTPNNQSPVLGIGTRSPNLSGVASHGTLVLKEVLHVPGFLCNIIGGQIKASDGYDVLLRFNSKTNGTIKDSRGKNVGYFDPKMPLCTLKVRLDPTGPRLGPHVLQKGGMYMLGCRWDAVEQHRWRLYQQENGATTALSGSAAFVNETPPYTDDEKTYLKEHWRDEYHFLLQYGLKIHDEEDRAEGRSILRALMHADDTTESSADDEWDPTGHQADYNFSHAQLDWIEEYYKNSENFMLTMGLKFYDDDDLEEAKVICDAMMAED